MGAFALGHFLYENDEFICEGRTQGSPLHNFYVKVPKVKDFNQL